MPELPIEFLELMKLTSSNIPQSAIRFSTCSLQSDHYISVVTKDENRPSRTPDVITIGLKNGNKIRRLRRKADSAVMHWYREIIAVSSRRVWLELFDISESENKVITFWVADEELLFFKWISESTIAIVTRSCVYNWNVFVADENGPVEVFRLSGHMKDCQITEYKVDTSGRWMVLSGLVSTDGRVAGRMQLYSVDRNVSQDIEGHAAAFSSIRLDGAVVDTKLLVFAVRTITGAKLHIVEYDHRVGNPEFEKKVVDIWYPPEAEKDFPTAVQISKAYGVIFVVTKFGFIHIYELETGLMFFSNRLSSSTVFTITANSDSTGFIGVNRDGQLLSVKLNTTSVIPYLLRTDGMEVALQLASRAVFEGGEDLYTKRFNQLLDEGKYTEAAKTAIRSPKGFLRTGETLEKLKRAPTKTNEMTCILQYFGLALDRDVLNKTETLELSRPVLQQNRKHLLKKWLDEDKLYCSTELADLVRPYDGDLADTIYVKASGDLLKTAEVSLIEFNETKHSDENVRQSAQTIQPSDNTEVARPRTIIDKSPVRKPLPKNYAPAVESPRNTTRPPHVEPKPPGPEREPARLDTHDSHDDFPEIVRDSRLSQATIQHDGGRTYTIHNRAARSRAAPRNEIWLRQKLLGQGGFGFVHLEVKQMEKSGPPEYRAVKTFRMKDGHLKIRQTQYVRELEAIAKFSQNKYDEFFVKSLGWYTSPMAIHIAMEYCELGDLKGYLSDTQKCGSGRLPEDQVQEIAFQVLKALSLMHKERFAHRDLKPANILIKAHPPEPWWVKVCDMGLSKRVGNIEESFTVCGTPSFMPPELLDAPKTKSVDPYLADMWCFGETIFQTLTGEGTFRNHLDIGRYYDGYVKFPTTTLNQAGASQPAIDFLVSVMASNPLERLTAEKARNHGWMEADLQSLTEKTASIDLRSQVGSFGSFPTGPFEPLDESTMVSGEWTDTIVDHRAVLP